MIEIQNLSKAFPTPFGKKQILDNFTLTVPAGTFLGISGKSGAGKSTLLSIIAGLQKPDSGKVLISSIAVQTDEFETTDIFSLNDKELSLFRNKNIGFVSQEQSFLENYTVFDNVRLPYFICANKKPTSKETEAINKRTTELLEDLGIAHLAQSYPKDLSGGENHRVLIARALINNPENILADEPTESVDTERTGQIIEIFKKLSKHGKTIILVSHDEKVLQKCDKICRL